ATEPPQDRESVEQEAYEYGDRIAGQAEDDRVADLAKRHWLPRLDGQLPHMTAADRVDRSDHMILIAMARPTAAQDDIVARRGLREAAAHLIDIVGPDAEIGD